MADDERHRHVRLRPAIPLVDVQVRTADAGLEYADQHIVPARRGDWNILKREAGLSSRLDQRFHSAPGRSPQPGTAASSGPPRCFTQTQPYRSGAAGLRVTTQPVLAPAPPPRPWVTQRW